MTLWCRFCLFWCSRLAALRMYIWYFLVCIVWYYNVTFVELMHVIDLNSELPYYLDASAIAKHMHCDTSDYIPVYNGIYWSLPTLVITSINNAFAKSSKINIYYPIYICRPGEPVCKYFFSHRIHIVPNLKINGSMLAPYLFGCKWNNTKFAVWMTSFK